MHHCPVAGCTSSKPMSRLMCYFHWHFVPPSIKRRILASWNGGECTTEHAELCAYATRLVNAKMEKIRPRAG